MATTTGEYIQLNSGIEAIGLATTINFQQGLGTTSTTLLHYKKWVQVMKGMIFTSLRQKEM
jgi:hypothetical protein